MQTDTPRSPSVGTPSLSVDELKESILRYARFTLGLEWSAASPREKLLAVSLAAREPVLDGMLETERRHHASGAKRVYYLSLEFLAGRALVNNLINLGTLDACAEAVEGLGARLEDLIDIEPDPALGNGGLGRLAACFLDSMATLGVAGYGYGINYEFGLFRQHFKDGYQRELPDVWRKPGSPWLIQRPELCRKVALFGRIAKADADRRREAMEWKGTREVVGVPFDMPIVGYGGRTINYLRLYTARASDEFDMEIFNNGDYVKAVEQKVLSQRISKVLYPSDDNDAGRELRLIQEYFFVSCALADILERHCPSLDALRALPDKVAIQLNDTHPALAIAELQRILVDRHRLPWDEAFDITRRVFSYTNHTLLPEAQERWPVSLLERVLPRHLRIIYDLNDSLLDEVEASWPDDDDRRGRMSIIEEGDDRQVRMAHLAMFGSHAVNGVSELHSRLLRERLARDFDELYPGRFQNKTNGVTQRRWMLLANRPLAKTISRLTGGDDWITDLSALRRLEAFVDDDATLSELGDIKRSHKERLAETIKHAIGCDVNPESLFDVQIKRLHEYKRQLLNGLRIAHDYLALVEDGVEPVVPRTYVFGGKAAPGYAVAKTIIKLINEIGTVVNHDPRTRGLLRVAFLPDYRVTLAERIIPAADISEQISTAGMEASGTGNMKFMMNGALTVGTLDGANVEMLAEAGEENMFIFGLTTEQVEAHRRDGTYHPREVADSDTDLMRVLDAVRDGRFSAREPDIFRGLVDGLLEHDPYFVLADFRAFIETSAEAGRQYKDARLWQRKCLLNIARSGRFSSDRTIAEYAREIWRCS